MDTGKILLFQSLRNAGGDEGSAGAYLVAGVPGISGWSAVGGWQGVNAVPLGAFQVQIEETGQALQTTIDPTNNLSSILFDASLCSPVYGASGTVMPASVNIVSGLYLGRTA